MSMWTVRSGLEYARSRLVDRSIDPRVVGVEQAQIGENINAVDRALNALRPDNTIIGGQRTARSTDLYGRVQVTIHLDAKYKFPPDEFYNALDLMWACADAIAAGVPDFELTL